MTDKNRYSSIATINHWVTALLVVVMLALGYAVAAAPSDEIEDYVLGIHVSLGFFVFLFVIWRVLFRLREGFPESIGKSTWERRAASLVQRGALILLSLLVVTGPLYLFTENECVDVFGWFSVCVPLESLSAIHEPAEWLHVMTGLYVLPALLAAHLAGAIRHYAHRGAQESPSDL